MSTPHAIIFDLDDTLCDTRGSMLTALAAVSRVTPAFSGLSPAELYETQTRIMKTLEARVFSGELGPQEIRARRFELMLAERGEHAGGHEAAKVYRAAYRASFRPLPGAGALLRELRARGLKVGVLTNYLREVQLEVLEAVGLLSLVDSLVTVSEAPPKPHPASYAAICAALNVDPSEAVMVGDNWHNDVAGAAAAGLRAVWYNPSGQVAAGDVAHTVLAGYLPLDAALAALG